jgi:broad specificity phosphatase PhoE
VHAQIPDKPLVKAGIEGVASGAITLARHGEPALSRDVRLDSQGYRDWWAAYELGGLLAGQTPPDLLLKCAAEAGFIFSSTRRRAIETAEAVCRGKPFEALDMFVEAPLPPPRLPEFIRMTPKSSAWGTVARLSWRVFNHHQGQETYAEARARAVRAADFLIDKASRGDDVLLLAHGYFNWMISKELKRRGFGCTLEQGFKYWSCRRYECPQKRAPSGK